MDKKIILIPITITVCLDHLLFLVAPVACSFGCNMGNAKINTSCGFFLPCVGVSFSFSPNVFCIQSLDIMNRKKKGIYEIFVIPNSRVVFKLHLKSTFKTWWCLLYYFCLYASSNFLLHTHTVAYIEQPLFTKSSSCLHTVQSSIDLSIMCWRPNILQ